MLSSFNTANRQIVFRMFKTIVATVRVLIIRHGTCTYSGKQICDIRRTLAELRSNCDITNALQAIYYMKLYSNLFKIKAGEYKLVSGNVVVI